MIILDTITRKLQLKLGGAVTTNELPWIACYTDITTTTFTPAASNGVTTGATAVDIIGVPGASTQRQVKFIAIQNADTAIAEVSIIYNDNGTLRTIWKGSLAIGDNLQYLDGKGFVVVTSSGQIKNTGSMTDHATLANLSYASAGHTGFQATLSNSAGLATALSDETGTGFVVFSDSPVFTTQITTPKIVTASGNLELSPNGGYLYIGPFATSMKLENSATVGDAGSGSGFASDGSAVSIGAWAGPITFYSGNNGATKLERVRITGAGNVGIRVTSPTAAVHLPAGTTVANTGPLKFTLAGASLLTTPEAGVLEPDSAGALYFTNSSAARKTIAFLESPVFTTQISTPKIVTASGNLEITPVSNANIILQGSGTGNVGIGTTGPLSKLSINGGLHVGGDSDAGDNNALIDGTLGVTGTSTLAAVSATTGTFTASGAAVTIGGSTRAFLAFSNLFGAPSAVGGDSEGDKVVLFKNGTEQYRIGLGSMAEIWQQGAGGYDFYTGAGASSVGIKALSLSATGNTTLAGALGVKGNVGIGVFSLSLSPFHVFESGTAIVTPGSDIPPTGGVIEGQSYNLNTSGNPVLFAVISNSAAGIDAGGTIGLGGKFIDNRFAEFGIIKGAKENAINDNYSSYMAFGTRVDGGPITEKLRINSIGNIGVRTLSPTAAVHLPAGTTVANTAPLQFTSGSVETTKRAGLVEYDGRFIVTESDTTNRYLVQAASSTKTTAGAPYTNDGYVTVVINGTSIKLMTTA